MEQLRSFIPGYIAEGKDLNDADAVNGVLEYIKQNDIRVNEIVLSKSKRGIVAHLARYEQDGTIHFDGINWSKPGKTPDEYTDYPGMWNEFVFPDDMQRLRTIMLGISLGIPVKNMDFRDEKSLIPVLEIPSKHSSTFKFWWAK